MKRMSAHRWHMRQPEGTCAVTFLAVEVFWCNFVLQKGRRVGQLASFKDAKACRTVPHGWKLSPERMWFTNIAGNATGPRHAR